MKERHDTFTNTGKWFLCNARLSSLVARLNVAVHLLGNEKAS